MNIGVIGTVIDDRIHSLEGEVIRALGGILYTILPMRAFLPERCRIVPIMHVGHDLFDRVRELLDDLPEVETGWIVREECENNRVDLYYRTREERIEVSTRGVSPLLIDELDIVRELDSLIVNFISGWELTLATMKKLSRRPGSMICGDLHSLLLGRMSDGRRYFRKPYGWKAWLEHFDYIQLNEREFRTLTGFDFLAGENGAGGMHGVISGVFRERGARLVTVTQGERGATVFSLDGTGEGIRELHDIHAVEKPLDPTGSGDVFLAAFSSALLSGRNIQASLSFAVEAAALSTLTRGAEHLYEYFKEKGIGL